MFFLFPLLYLVSGARDKRKGSKVTSRSITNISAYYSTDGRGKDAYQWSQRGERESRAQDDMNQLNFSVERSLIKL